MNIQPKAAPSKVCADVASDKLPTHGTDSECNHVEAACAFIQKNYRLDINVKDIAASIAIDRTYLYRLFCKYKGVSPSKYLRLVRLESTLSLILNDGYSIKEASKAIGFHDLSHFYRVFKSEYGISPKKYIAAIKLNKSNDI